jgi:hypothetical protein
MRRVRLGSDCPSAIARRARPVLHLLLLRCIPAVQAGPGQEFVTGQSSSNTPHRANDGWPGSSVGCGLRPGLVSSPDAGSRMGDSWDRAFTPRQAAGAAVKMGTHSPIPSARFRQVARTRRAPPQRRRAAANLGGSASRHLETACWRTTSIRSFARADAPASMSVPTNRRPVPKHARAVVPDPKKGSTTCSPGRVTISTSRSNGSAACCHGWCKR